MSDYIYRSEALEAIRKSDSLHSAYINLAKLRYADVRPARRGRWIPVGTDDMDGGMFRCSECGSEHFFPELLLKIPADNFCSDCGADMQPEEGET